jgi:uncharacterized protein (PEP-CTERM system associated)
MAVMASTASSSNAGLFLLACLVSTATWAGDWKFASGVSLSERYSDNVNLDVAGSEQSEWITEISPRISVRRDGARIKANLDYSLQGLLYANGVDSNKINHNLNGRASTELVEEWFFLDATARMSQELNSLSGGANVGGPVGLGNTTSVGAYSLSPYLKHRFGSFATVEAKLSRDGVFIGDSTLSDSASTRYTFSAVSGNYFTPLSWGANYSKSDTNNSVGAGSGSEQASVNARYSLSRQFGLLANANMEKNDFTGVTTGNIVRDYSSYGLGMFYTPSRRISMDALYNHSDSGNYVSGSVTLNPTLRTTVKASSSKRAFGRSYSLSLAHRTRQSNWNLSYSDDLTTSQQQYLQFLGGADTYICPAGKVYQPVGAPPIAGCTYDGITPFFSQNQINQTYLAKNLVGSVNYTLRRSTWQLSLFNNQREFQGLAGGSDTTRGLHASWSLKPAAHTTFTLTGGMSHVESIGTPNRQDDLWNVALVATHQFQPKVTGSLEARHQERKSNLVGSDFTENSVAARMNLAF